MIATKDSLEPHGREASDHGGTPAVASHEKNGADSEIVREQDNAAPSSDKPLPNSRKVYIDGQIHPAMRVPFSVMSSVVETSLTI